MRANKGLKLLLAALCSGAASAALASGREGEQYVPVVLVIVAVALFAFVASLTVGVVIGGVQARRNGESALKGGLAGVLKGLWYFVIVGAVTTGVVTLLGFLWIVYAFLAPGLQDAQPEDRCAAEGEPIQWVADYCMLKMETDDEIAVSDCIEEERKKAFTDGCASNRHFKKGMCEAMIRNGTKTGTVDQCVQDPTFKGRVVESGGVGG